MLFSGSFIAPNVKSGVWIDAFKYPTNVPTVSGSEFGKIAFQNGSLINIEYHSSTQTLGYTPITDATSQSVGISGGYFFDNK